MSNLIGKKYLKNASGLTKITLIPARFVSGVITPDQRPHPVLENTICPGGILLFPNAKTYTVRNMFDQADFSLQEIQDRSGSIFRFTSDLVVKKKTLMIPEEFAEMIWEEKEFVAIIEDNNGEVYLAGSEETPLKAFGSGTVNLSRFHFYGDLLEFWSLESSDPGVLFPGREFDYSFDFSFS